MPTYLSQEDFFHRYFEEFGDGIEPSPENLTMVREFLLEKWRQRAAELDKEPPTDLTDSCKFSALFGSVVFGADIGGNWNHVYNLVDGEIVDINAEAADVKGRRGIYKHDSSFIESYDFRESMKTCRERVSTWLREFAPLYTSKLDADNSSAPGM
ncbi:hypothetical protein [Rhizobium sp. MHM7A]|uniref:hypothetical protein n=1 Tax=Rhizobium sp. MHM7A TaxID=2583233 RepID=UPI001106ACAD|nr:hypothetical protein [Rhizobium sp. MHM7A]TLX17062.1 hypothetical protein FFR93_07045 [Rhizobium sp. MHM7A]